MRAILELARRLANSVRPSRGDADLEEELRSHLELAVEDERRRGQTDLEARRRAALRAGGLTQAMESTRHQRTLPSVDAVTADVVFGWRQLARHRLASLSAILSLGLAMGATIAAFRLVDAVLLKPLPVSDPSRLFVIARTVVDTNARVDDRDDFDYPTYRQYAALVGDRADLMVLGLAGRRPVAIAPDRRETAVQQFVSGNVFSTLGLQPALGRLLGQSDDLVANGHPVVVISHDYWQRRFGGDPAVVGRTIRMSGRVYEIVGVLAAGFTGTEPGALTDLFVPAMMNGEALENNGWSWFRIWVRPRLGVLPDEIQAVLQARFRAEQLEGARQFAPDTPKARIDAYLSEELFLRSAASGVSPTQKAFRRPLWILALLAALLLLIACANVANLLLARALSRRVEMALRLSIGAARGRLVQLLLIESAWLALLSTVVGALFAWWAAPLVVSMLAPAERPVRLVLDLDWRTVGTGAAMTLAVTMLFGLAPALQASGMSPIEALKETRSRRGPSRLSDVLVAAQMAFCVFLLFGASLFVGTLERLQHRPLGFAPGDLLHVKVEGRETLPPETWTQLATALGQFPGVESATVAGWAPLTGNRWRSSVIVPGQTPPGQSPNWVSVSPGYFDTMRMRLVAGRGFRAGDVPPGRTDAGQPVPGVAVVNETFARAYFGGRSPVGQRVRQKSSDAPIEIVGLVADAVYFSVREANHPSVFVPLEPRSGATILVRTTPGTGDLRQPLTTEVSRLQPGIGVRDVERFETFVAQQMIRERLLAALSSFFAALALVLAVIGIYGVLNYAVTRERREIGLRMALGARPVHVVALIPRRLLGVVCVGAVLGVAGGVAFGRAVQALLFEMAPTSPMALAVPLAALAGAAVLAVLPPAIRAVRVDPALTIRTEA